MKISDILALYNTQQRINIEYPGVQKEVLPNVVRFVRPAPEMSFISYCNLDEMNVDAVIQEEITYFRQKGRSFSWNVYDHDTPSNLKDRLIAAGFVPDFDPDDPGAVMILDLQEVPPTLLEPFNADVRLIFLRDQLDIVVRIMEQVYGGNFAWIKQRLGEALEIPDYLSVYVAYADAMAVCAGWIYFHPKSQFASLWGGSTLMNYRKKGIYTAVLAVRVREAVRRNYRFLTMEASPMSRPLVARYGFHLLTHARTYQWNPEYTP